VAIRYRSFGRLVGPWLYPVAARYAGPRDRLRAFHSYTHVTHRSSSPMGLVSRVRAGARSCVRSRVRIRARAFVRERAFVCACVRACAVTRLPV
jgi:hypothetical protein